MRKGLTLMELLTVISILATLAALLFPVYINLRTRTDITICADQLRQIGIALKMYAHDYGDDTPYGMPEKPQISLYPHYIQDRSILICPTFRKIGTSVIKAIDNFFQQNFGYGAWISYFFYYPRILDQAAKKPNTIIWASFAEVYAKRGDQIPIAFCDTHRKGCPTSNIDAYLLFPEAQYLDCHKIANPSAPILILRWSGSVNAVRGKLSDTTAMLLKY